METRFLFAIAMAAGLIGFPVRAEMKTLPAGTFKGFLKPSPGLTRTIRVDSFAIDEDLVTEDEYRHFTERHPEWSKSNAKQLFSDAHYLANWSVDATHAAPPAKSPVNFVSWYAANAYCRSLGKELPTTEQWEYALDDNGRKTGQITAAILSWYSEPNARSLPEIGRQAPNGYGVRDLVGLVWEWTRDFGESSGPAEAKFVCGAAGNSAADPSDYAKFMRFSFRSSLQAKYALANLGFRCVKDKP